MRFYILAAVALATPSVGKNWPDIGGWSIVELSEGTGCSVSQTYEGQGATMLAVNLKNDGTVQVGLLNYNWSTVKGQSYKLVYELNGVEFAGGDSVGIDSGDKKGFASKMQAPFLDDFAAGSSLRVRFEDSEELIDALSLKGTADGVAMLRRCVASTRAEAAAAAREKARLAHIPVDPFAGKN